MVVPQQRIIGLPKFYGLAMLKTLQQRYLLILGESIIQFFAENISLGESTQTHNRWSKCSYPTHQDLTCFSFMLLQGKWNNSIARSRIHQQVV